MPRPVPSQRRRRRLPASPARAGSSARARARRDVQPAARANSLPVAAQPPLSSNDMQASSPPGPPNRVLVVEDDPDVREALQDALESAGITAEAARDGQAA